jgi:hypothetical protein
MECWLLNRAAEVDMNANIIRTMTLCSVLLLVASPGFGHHFFPRESDTPVSIVGTVVKFEMRNPHSRVTLEVRDRAGNVTTWLIEMGSVANLVARGWARDSVKAGDVITVEAILGKGTPNLAAARGVVLPDGHMLFGGSHAGDKSRPW